MRHILHAHFHWLVFLTFASMVALSSSCLAQEEMSYMLLDDSLLVDDCTICGRPPIILSMRGTFRLVFREENPLYKVYDVKGVRFSAGAGLSEYDVTGEGTYQIGGEVALIQRMELWLTIGDLQVVRFLSGEGPIERMWPMIEMKVSEPIEPTTIQFFWMHLIAAPVREIWFSTLSSFTSGIGKPSGTGGDLLSHVGRIVKRNSELVGKLGIMPMVPPLGLDAVDILPGGEVLFSTEEDAFSERLGPLQHGDLLSDRGRIFQTNQELTAGFGMMPMSPDVGLDAVQMKDDGEILFSVETDFFSENLGVMVGRGDLLSDKGAIVRTNKELLENFEPVDAQGNLGLDALYVWPSGEIWFSTEVGFQSKSLGPVGEGDLLSTGDVVNNEGSIIFRNLELLQAFGPIEDLASFGLDALFLVTEDTPPTPTTDAINVAIEQEFGDVRIEWVSKDAKVFRVERADDPGGPYVPAGPISPKADFIDAAAALSTKSFYRLRLW